MRKRTPVCSKTDNPETGLPLSRWERLIEGWILDGEIRQFSERTIEERRNVTGKLLWFLRDREYPTCHTPELRAFLAYVTTGHKSRGGRWGNPRNTTPASPATAKAYHRVLRALCNWLVEDGSLTESPMGTLKPPVVRADQIQPFTPDQVNALLAAARKSPTPQRDEAILMILLDTGCRATELVELRAKDLDLSSRKARIRGKGNKERTIYLGKQATKAVWTYLRDEPREPDETLFASDRGTTPGEGFTRNGLRKLIKRLGDVARLEAVRCSPHTFRHTFAVEFLRGGGNTFTLKELLGHTTLAMTNKYVALAAADLESQHRQFSPGDRLKKR